MRTCRRCGSPLAGLRKNAVFCGTECRRQWHRADDPEPAGGDPDELLLAERRKLQGASYAAQLCRCPHPIGLVDEDGEVSCFRCGRPVARTAPGG